MTRIPFDFYETAPWQTRALLKNQPISGSVLECCSGDGSITEVLREAGLNVITNDIDPAREADFHLDAADPLSYEEMGPVPFDWIITNPPYQMPLCRDIVMAAVDNARVGVAMMLRISFREPTAKVNPRGGFLERNPISRVLTLPRHSFTGNGKSDSATTEWAIWLKPEAAGFGLPPILSLYQADQF